MACAWLCAAPASTPAPAPCWWGEAKKYGGLRWSIVTSYTSGFIRRRIRLTGAYFGLSSAILISLNEPQNIVNWETFLGASDPLLWGAFWQIFSEATPIELYIWRKIYRSATWWTGTLLKDAFDWALLACQTRNHRSSHFGDGRSKRVNSDRVKVAHVIVGNGPIYETHQPDQRAVVLNGMPCSEELLKNIEFHRIYCHPRHNSLLIQM